MRRLISCSLNFSMSVLLIGLAASRLAFAQTPAPSPTPGLTAEQKKSVVAARDAARNADRSVTSAEETRRSADGKTTLIASLTTFDAADESAMTSLDQLADTIASVGRLNILTELNDRNTELAKAKTDLTKARDALPAQATDEADEISAARKECNDILDRIDKQAKAETASRKKLTDSLTSAPAKVKILIELLPEGLTPLSGIDAADAPALRPALTEGLPNLTSVWRLKTRLRQRWTAVKKALAEASGSDEVVLKAVNDAIKPTDDALKGVDDQAAAILPNLQPAFDKLKTLASGEASATSSKVAKVINDPVGNSPDGMLQVKNVSDVHSDLDRIGQAWVALVVELKGVTVPKFDLTKTSRSAQDLVEADKNLNVAGAVLQDALTGDASEFVADNVSLFYYTDVPRIMQMLNSATYRIGGIKGAQEQAAAERRKLTEAEFDLADAQAEVNKDQRRLLELQEELRQTRASLSSSASVLLKSSRNLKSIQDDDKKNQDRLTKAKSDLDANPTDPEKRLAFDRASSDADKSSARLRASEQRNEDATRERDAAKERNDALTNEQTGLPTKIQQARDTLEAAQSAVSRQRRAAFLAAQTESDAFAMARDNTPFWYGPAIASSRDPVKRVLMYAFNDSKTIFLRGKPADIGVVKDIIARFDTPAPQARLTLWTMEMSSDTSPKGTEHFNKALQLIEDLLGNDRALTAASISFLRDCLNAEVNRVADEKFNNVDSTLPMADRYFLARLYFYHPEARTRLGFNEKAADKTEAARFARFSLPDPAGTTTLGETLMVLSLGTRFSRNAVMNAFRDGLKTRLQALNLANTNSEGQKSWRDDTQFFTRTYRALGLDGQGNALQPWTSMQEEITRALERLLLDKSKKVVRRNLADINDLEEKKALERRGSPKQMQLEAARRNIVRNTIPLLNLLRTRFGIYQAPQLTFAPDKAGNMEETKGEMESFWKTAAELNPLRSANARTAAADQMLKELMIAVEDDIEYHFVQRMLNHLRQKITRDKIGVGLGVLQRTSMLATNRLIARVDPRASAQLGVGEEQNILESVQQLAQIYQAASTAGLLGVLGAADKQPRQIPPEIYGINTGSNFQVTPIFDPSGQALRFKFDYVAGTRVQEPNGTVNLQLPRIERHTVNTEVQLSNLELREISRFESNSRIGLPTTYSGGLPIFRDIPKIRPYLPLLGWFVRKGGKAAVVQQSLIFGQTTMYPTIADIMDLLTAPVSP